MTKIFTALQICELSLQEIGAYSTADGEADPVELERTLQRLDLIVGELAGTEACYWLRAATITISLTSGTASYNLATVMGSSKPADGILFPVHAFCSDGNGNDTPIKILRREEFEGLGRKATSGAPEAIFIDRLPAEDEQNIYVYPVPANSTQSLKLVVQAHAPDLTASSGDVSHSFWPAWQRYLVKMTAADIGGGPVRRLSDRALNRIEAQAARSFSRLQASSNREHVGPRRVQPWG